MMYFGIFFSILTMSIYKTSAQSLLSDKLLSIFGAIGAICNGLSRLIVGILQDRYGFKKLYGCLLSIQLVNTFVIFHVRGNAPLYFICVAYAFLMNGAHVGCFPPLAVQLFGMKSGPKMASFVTYSACLSAPTSSLLL